MFKFFEKYKEEDFKKNEYISYRIKFFFNLFKEKFGNRKFRISSESDEKSEISSKLYNKIIHTYLNIYFYELFFSKKPMYFFLTGKMTIGVCGNKISYTNNHTKPNIGLIWYLRPDKRFLLSFQIKKQKGSTGALPKIEEEWKKENDIRNLEKVKDLKPKIKFVR